MQDQNDLHRWKLSLQFFQLFFVELLDLLPSGGKREVWVKNMPHYCAISQIMQILPLTLSHKPTLSPQLEYSFHNETYM